jgi:transposase
VRVLGSGKSQKNFPNDARSIAIAALRADDLRWVCADDHAQVLKLLSKRHRELGRLKNKASCHLHALLLEMIPGVAGFRITTVTRINAVIDEFEPTDAMGRQRQDIDRYNDLLDSSKQRIQTAVAASGTSLTTISGVGPITAAMIIGQAGNIDRFKSKASLRELQRHRPGRGVVGIYSPAPAQPARQPATELGAPVIAISQFRHDTAGRQYFDRKVAEGTTAKEAIRSLKRRISDVVYRHLVADARQQR